MAGTLRWLRAPSWRSGSFVATQTADASQHGGDAIIDVLPFHVDVAERDGSQAHHAQAHQALGSIPTLRIPRLHGLVKRLLDAVLALAMIIVLSPLLVVLAIVIRLDSPGKAIFKQQRVGAGGKHFTFYKFRTMYEDARERFPDYYRYQYEPGEIDTLFFKLADDPRLTRFGALLRRTSLDELPNLFNVLRGDMSLVGPRPEIPEMLPYYEHEELAKFSVKPGVTGLSQISGRNILRFKETNGWDLAYVRNYSLAQDLRILAHTPLVVIRMIGAL